MKSSFFERNVPRPMPKFSREEIGLGKLLGIGGFCRVHEGLTEGYDRVSIMERSLCLGKIGSYNILQ